MTTLGDCASILQLAFGVNAVSAASQLYFDNTHRQISRRLFAELHPREATAIEEDEERVFEKYVLRSSPGLRKAKALYPILTISGLAATAISFFGLVFSATHSNQYVPHAAVWGFSALTLVVLPSVYWAYQSFLRWFEKGFLASILQTPEKRDFYWKTFETILPMDRQSREIKEVIALAQDYLVRTEWSRFQDRVMRRWERVCRFFKLPWR